MAAGPGDHAPPVRRESSRISSKPVLGFSFNKRRRVGRRRPGGMNRIRKGPQQHPGDGPVLAGPDAPCTTSMGGGRARDLEPVASPLELLLEIGHVL